jgi:hypothetical protein
MASLPGLNLKAKPSGAKDTDFTDRRPDMHHVPRGMDGLEKPL